MRLGVSLKISSGSALALAAIIGFTPSSLFAASEVGVWYDPSDLTTLFQDSAGTTPVTAVEQPVGLVLDKSKGAPTLGSELITNGDFSSGTTGWSSGAFSGYGGTFTNVGNAGVISVSGSFYWVWQGFATVVGRTYRATGTLSNISGGSTYNIRKTDNTDMLSPSNAVNIQGPSAGSASMVFVATATTTYIVLQVNGAGATATFDNISVKELPGNHASQSTAASRPVLSARVNLLTYSEQFDNAVWVKSSMLAFGSGSVANTTATTDPIGGNTADKLTPTTANAYHTTTVKTLTVPNAAITVSVCAKSAGYDYLSLIFSNTETFTKYYEGVFNLSNGTVEGTSRSVTYTGSRSITSLGNGWYRCSITVNSADANSTSLVQLQTCSSNDASVSFAGDGTKGTYLWGADLRVSNDGVGLPSYQRVDTATSYDDGASWPRYLRFDGTDDSLATASIDFSSTAQMSVFAGVRKLSDATAIVAELSANVGASAGSFFAVTGADVFAGSQYSASSTGSATLVAALSTYTTAGGTLDTAVIATTHDIPGDLSLLRRNGVAGVSATGDQGTGKFGNYPLYIGSRNSASLRFNGRLYSLIVLGRTATAAEITSTENWINGKTKAYA